MSINRTRSESIVVSDMTLYVAVAGSDSTGDGTSANPWASPHKALEWLSTVTIQNDARVVISVGAGDYYFDSPMVIDSPNFARVRIVGAGSFSQLTGVPVRDYSTNRNDVVTPIDPGTNQFYNTAGQLPANTAYDSTVRNDAIIADRVNNLAKINIRFSTVFNFSDQSSGIELRGSGSLGYLQYIAFIGSGTADYNDGQNKHNCGIFSDNGSPRTGNSDPSRKVYAPAHTGSITVGDRIVFANFRHGVRFYGDTTLYAGGLDCVSNFAAAMWFNGMVNVTGGTGTFTGNSGNGIVIENGRFSFGASFCCGNKYSGAIIYSNAQMHSYSSTFSGNGSWGIMNYGIANIGGNQAGTSVITISGNRAGGLHAQRNSYYGLRYNVNIIGNNGRGVYLDDASVMNFYLYNEDTDDFPDNPNVLHIENNISPAVDVRDSSILTVNDEMTVIPDDSVLAAQGGSQIICVAKTLDPSGFDNFEFRPPYDTISRDGSYIGPGTRAISGPPVVTWQIASDNTSPINTDGKVVGSVIFVTGTNGGTTYNIPMWAASAGAAGIWKSADKTVTITPSAP